MSSKFAKDWTKQDNRSISEKVKEAITPQGPLKPKIVQASNKLQIQIQKMESLLARIKERDNRIFRKIVAAQNAHDLDTAKALANELAELRKIEKIITNGKIALEQINNRLSTVQDLGDALVALSPAITVMKAVQRGLTKIMPEAETEIQEINNTLNGLLIETIGGYGFSISNEVVSEDAEKILAEASMIAESSIDSKLPIPDKAYNKGELPKST